MVYEARGFARPMFLLRRLACPHLPPNPLPGQPVDPGQPYNPYVTVDYMENVRLNSGNPASPRFATRASEGRKQPYAAHSSQTEPQGLDAVAPPEGPQPPPAPRHTFFRQNAAEQAPQRPFDWLVHLDRPLISPMELLHVSAFKPHELTQQFRTGDADGQTFAHRAPWADQGARLSRALEFLATRSRAAGLEPASVKLDRPLLAGTGVRVELPGTSGVAASGAVWKIRDGDVLVVDRGVRDAGGNPLEENVRVSNVTPTGFTADFLRSHPGPVTFTLTTLGDRVPGRININTVWDEETLQALCDAQPANHFNTDTVRQLFEQMRAHRTPGGAPGPADRPFRGQAVGSYPLEDAQFPGIGIEDTFLRSSLGQPLFQVPGVSHPYQRYELMTKIYNHVTTRSNVFAVWLTVGFFEVIDDSARPVKLGAEIGRAEGRHIRHRMFAIVDRSVLRSNPGPQPGFDPRTAGGLVPYFNLID
jgi:hypothetical protein